MSRNTDCSFFAISGMRGSGRSRLFRKLESALPAILRDHTFAFFEDPFGNLPHPLLWVREEAELDPTSRLFKCWVALNEFNKKLRPALDEFDVVVVDGYGLNAVLYATAFVGDNKEDDDSATRMHHHLVKARILEQGISPPEYFITRADAGEMSTYLREVVPGISVEQCRAFIQKEERIIREYFGPGTGQNGHILESSCSFESAVEDVVAVIGRRLASASVAA